MGWCPSSPSDPVHTPDPIAPVCETSVFGGSPDFYQGQGLYCSQQTQGLSPQGLIPRGQNLLDCSRTQSAQRQKKACCSAALANILGRPAGPSCLYSISCLTMALSARWVPSSTKSPTISAPNSPSSSGWPRTSGLEKRQCKSKRLKLTAC